MQGLTLIPEEQFKRLRSVSKLNYKRFFTNIDHLGRKRYKSRNAAIIALRTVTGWATKSETISSLKSGKYERAEFDHLIAWSMLFGYSVSELLSRDFAAEDEAKEAGK